MRVAKPTKAANKRAPTASTPRSISASTFAATKRDKRHIKHSKLISRVSKSYPRNSTEAERNRRRRQKRQLLTNLDSLADALPDQQQEDGIKNIVPAAVPRSRAQSTIAAGLMQRKGINKSRPGAMKRREKADKSERERFAKNMSQLAKSKVEPELKTNEAGEGVEVSGTLTKDEGSRAYMEANQPPSKSNSWAALRGFIAQTIQKRPDTVTAPT